MSLFLQVLDDLWDFHTKFLFLVFNFWEAENLLFLVFSVSGATGTQMEKGKLPSWFFIGRTEVGRRSKGGEPRGPKEGGPRGQILWPRGAHQMEPRALSRSGLFNTSSSRPKRDGLIFPSPSEAAAAAKLLIPSEGGQILLLRRRGKSSSSSSPLLLGVGGGLYIITPIKTSTISIIMTVIHSVPLAV